jgi:hypothetical protein
VIHDSADASLFRHIEVDKELSISVKVGKDLLIIELVLEGDKYSMFCACWVHKGFTYYEVLASFAFHWSAFKQLCFMVLERFSNLYEAWYFIVYPTSYP